MSDFSPRQGGEGDKERQNFPTRRDILRERQLRAAEEARKEERRRARAARRAAEGGEHGTPQAPTAGEYARQAGGQPPRRTRSAAHQRAAQEQYGGDERVLQDPLTTGTRSRRVAAERARVMKRRRNAKIRTAVILTAVIAVIAVCVYIAANAILNSRTQETGGDFPGPGSGQVEVVVNPGDSGGVIGANLVELGVVKSEDAFLQAWIDNAAANSLQPGTYTLMKEMRAVDALAALLDPANRTSNAITVPPGFTKNQVVDRLSEFAGFNREDVEAAMNDPEAIGLPAEAGGDPEGWLAPGSYDVHSDETPADVIARMVDATVALLDSLGVPQGERQEVIIKASILEREVNIDQYYPMVARVIENRLSMPEAETVGFLNMDSTVLYGVGKVGGVPTSAELADESNPYNTYRHKGLPPTPISSPSVLAVESTLNPEPGDWLYFVTVNLDTGETKFAATLVEQEENRAEFDAWCEANAGKC
ncbi:MAG: endolytic transglycosylase MltG [Actinomycetaceae bacterium]|nr:endolytic transglycosylase MltG [Actinomycetaceae bacterium]